MLDLFVFMAIIMFVPAGIGYYFGRQAVPKPTKLYFCRCSGKDGHVPRLFIAPDGELIAEPESDDDD